MAAIAEEADLSRDIAFVRAESAPILPPPPLHRGAVGWARANLFSGPWSSLGTILSLALMVWLAPGLARWLFIDAVWSAPDGEACRAPGAGACWAFVGQKFSFFMYSSYPRDQAWRVDIALVVGAVLAAWLLAPRASGKGLGALLFFVLYPVLTFILVHGWASVGLPVVETNLWGGVFVSLMVSVVGIVVSLPGGVLLALGRRSRLPLVRGASVLFIELVRGVPLITVLYMANLMLPLFLPENWAPDRLLRPLVAIALFASAYMAEVVRGGLQSMPKGQFEGAMALGLGYGRMMRLIVLPQALTKVIPGIVNTFIGLFKDTTLVAIVAIFDFLKTVEVASADAAWSGPTIATTGYVFAALFYFVFCFGMSRYSQWLERDLARDRNR